MQLRTAPPDGSVAFKTKDVSLGAVAVGTPVTTSVDLANRGKTNTSFRVVDAPGMTVTPTSGIIPAGDSVPLSVTVVCVDTAPFRSALQLERRGGGGAKLTVAAEPAQPEARVLEAEFDFGQACSALHVLR